MSSRVERYVATIQGAKHFLERLSVSVRPVSTDTRALPNWTVSGWPGELTNEELVMYAESKGFEPEAVRA